MPDTRFILTDGTGRQLDDHVDAWTAERRRRLDDHVWTDDLTLDITSRGVDKGRYLIASINGEWREWRVSSPDEIREDTRPRCDIACVDSMRELAVTRHIEHFHETSVTPRRALELVLQGTRWNVGEVPDMEPIDLELDAMDGWAALTTIAERFALETWSTMSPNPGVTRIAGRTVHMAPRRGRTSGRRFQYRTDLRRIRRTFDATEVATRIIPLGKQVESSDGTKNRVTIEQANNGSIWLDTEDKDLEQRWGVADANGSITPSCAIVIHDDIEDPGLLRNAGLLDLETMSRPSVTYEATVTDWLSAGLDGTGLGPGDTVQIVDTSFNPSLRLEGRVTGIDEDLLDGPDTAVVTIGDITEGISSTRTIAVDTAATVASGKPLWDAGAANAATAVNAASTANTRVTELAAGLTGFLTVDGILPGDNVTIEQIDGHVRISATPAVFEWEPISDEEIRALVWGNPGTTVDIINPGFETGNLDGWAVTGNTAIASDTPGEGSYFAYLKDTGTLSQTMKISPGSMYVASCLLMNKATDRTMGYRLDFDNGDPVETIIPCTTIGKWERLELRFTSPDECSTVTFRIIGSQHIRVDDVSITPVVKEETS